MKCFRRDRIVAGAFLVAFGALVAGGGPALAVNTVFQDGAFVVSDWDVVPVGINNGGTGTGTLVGSGGHSGAYLSVQNRLNAAAGANVSGVYTGFIRRARAAVGLYHEYLRIGDRTAHGIGTCVDLVWR